MTSRKRRILLTGGRSTCALELARQLSGSGHEVYAADTSDFHILRYSNAIKKMHVFPSPRFAPREFSEKLLSIVDEEKIDLLIPIWEEAYYLSKFLDRFPDTCEVFCSRFENLHELHNKWLFRQLLVSLGIKAPHTELVTSEKDLQKLRVQKPFILKKCYSRAAKDVIKVENEIPAIKFEENNPWIAQEFINGERYCTYSVCNQGKVLAHAAYDVKYTIDGNSCVAFDSMEHAAIYKWVSNFVKKTNYTGQIAFDFIETPEGDLYTVDCNPRATSGIHLFKSEDRIDRAFLNETSKTIFPKVGNSQQIASGMLLYGIGAGISENRLGEYVKKFFSTKDVVYSSRDLKPILAQPLVFISYWLKSRQLGLPLPRFFTYDLDWDNEEG